MIDFSTHTTDSGTMVVRLGGELDAETNEYFFDCIKDEIENGHKRIVINCADLGYVSSLGLAALVRARSRIAKKGGRIVLSRVDSKIMDMLHLINFDRLFDIYPTEREAIEVIEKT